MDQYGVGRLSIQSGYVYATTHVQPTAASAISALSKRNDDPGSILEFYKRTKMVCKDIRTPDQSDPCIPLAALPTHN